MALVLADRVQEYSTTTGTGTLTLSGAYAGFQTFAAGIGNGNTCYYTITSDTNQWEVGIGTVGVGTLARTTLISSSTGSKVSFTGTLTVFVTYPAEKAIYQDASGNTLVPNLGSTTASAGSFTTLNSNGDTRLGGLSGNQSLQVNNVASAVNYAQIVGAATGSGPTISAQGADANIPLTILSKGTSDVFVGGTSTTASLKVSTVASQVNSFQVYGQVTGQGPTLAVVGPDANIGISFAAKGTGSVSLASNAQQVFSFKNLSGTDFTNLYNTTGQLNYTAAGSSTDISFYFGAKGTGSIQLASGGGTQAVVSNTASAVNYLQLTGAATGAAPTISAQGSDANISLALTAKATGGHTFNTGGGQQFSVAHTASAVDYLQATGNSGGFPSLSAQGASTNVSMVYGTKGTGGHNFTTNGTSVNQFVIAHTASAVNYVRVTGGATGVSPSISAQGSDTNIDLNLFTKGTGVLRFGTYTAGILAQTGYITITDAGGTSRRLLVG